MRVAGFGYASSATIQTLRDALALAEAQAGPVQALAAPADKTVRLTPLALARSLPLIAVFPADLVAQDTPTRSARSLAARATGSVAEACALAAAGPGARLLRARIISPDHLATCAIAERTTP